MSISSFFNNFASYTTPQESQHQSRQKLTPAAMQTVHGVSDIRLQREQLQKENEQIFTFLSCRGYFMARQPSPVVLGSRNAEKQAELAEIYQQLHQILQSSNQQLLEIVEWIQEAYQQMAQQKGQTDFEQTLQWTECEEALKILEQKVMHFMNGPGIQPNRQETQFSILLNDIERLNREKMVLQNCQRGGLNSAFELQQLLKALENEYKELEQKCSESKRDVILAEKNLSEAFREIEAAYKNSQSDWKKLMERPGNSV